MEFESKLFALEEMLENISSTIDNANVVAAQQSKLVAVLESSDEAENFKEFVDGVLEQNKNILEQVVQLERQNALLTEIIAKCRENEDYDKLTTMLLNALNVKM